MELIPATPRKPGRRQTVTARAWITRPDSKSRFISRVWLGTGKVYDRATNTTNRSKALDFNRAHLMGLLCKRSGQAAANEMQLDLPVSLPHVVQPLRASSSFRDASKTP